MGRLRENEGFEIVARSAGSHSPIDIWALKAPDASKIGLIKIVQSKGGKSGKRERKKVEESGLKRFEGPYKLEVEIV